MNGSDMPGTYWLHRLSRWSDGTLHCPECGGRITVEWLVEDIRLLRDPPRQFEPFTLYVRWQCFAVERHHGEWSEPYDPPVEVTP